MLSSLNMKGKMASVVPHGVLFRGSAEGKIRKGFINDDLIEAVIGVPQISSMEQEYLLLY